MPDFPIVDTHLHLWDPKRLKYTWLSDVKAIAGKQDLGMFSEVAKNIELQRMVFVQCDCDAKQNEKEVDWITGLAEDDDRLQGIVAGLALETGEACYKLMDKYSTNKLVKGVRRLIQDEADPEFCLQPDFVASVKRLAECNLNFDICIRHEQLPAVTELVKQCENTRFILDHMAKPDIKGKNFSPWKENITELAQSLNVACKISGMVNEADHDTWTVEDLRPYADHVIVAFGWERIMFGGDWPVSSLVTDYEMWVRTVDDLVGGAYRDDREKFYRHNAIKYYQLGV